MPGDEIFDSIRLRKDGVDFNQWPKLSCSDVGQMTIEANMLQTTGIIKATSFQGDGSSLDGVVKKAGDTMTGSLTIQTDLKVLGNLEVTGTTTFRNVEQHQGDLELGNEDTDQVRIHGIVRSTHSSGVLQVGVPLNVSGKITAASDWTGEEGALSLTGDKPTIRLTGGAITGNQSWILHVGSNGPGNLEFFRRTAPSSWTNVLSLAPSGKVGIGTSAPTLGLDVRGNAMWIGSGDSSQTLGGWRLGRWPDYPQANTWVYLSRADSTTYQDLAVGALWAGGALRFGTADDVAEMTPVKADDELEPGDVVVIAEPPDDRVLLKRSYQPYDTKVAGVVSDAKTAGLVIGGSHPTDIARKDVKPLALAGRVLTKVTTENGSIQVGDLLVTSSNPGYAMKATQPGHTLGKALQSFVDDRGEATVGKIWVLIHLGWFGHSSSLQGIQPI
ncbi:hypothetical protein [Phormidesmis priestleyi]